MTTRKADRSATTAFLVSGITSPYVVCSIFPFLVIGSHTDSLASFLRRASVFFLLSVAVPLFYVILNVLTHRITDLHVMVREQRTTVFLLATVSAGLLSTVYSLYDVPRELQAMAYVLFANGILFSVMNRFGKASVHAGGVIIAATVTGKLVHPGYYGIALVLPLVMWARIQRGRHTAGQGVTGATVSFISSYIILALYGY